MNRPNRDNIINANDVLLWRWIDYVESDNKELRIQNKKMEKALEAENKELRNYCYHPDNCRSWFEDDCDCGLIKLLNK